MCAHLFSEDSSHLQVDLFIPPPQQPVNSQQGRGLQGALVSLIIC